MSARLRSCPVTADPDAAYVFVRVGPGAAVTKVEVPVTCNLALDAGGHLVGVELLGLVVDLRPMAAR